MPLSDTCLQNAHAWSSPARNICMEATFSHFSLMSIFRSSSIFCSRHPPPLQLARRLVLCSSCARAHFLFSLRAPSTRADCDGSDVPAPRAPARPGSFWRVCRRLFPSPFVLPLSLHLSEEAREVHGC